MKTIIIMTTKYEKRHDLWDAVSCCPNAKRAWPGFERHIGTPGSDNTEVTWFAKRESKRQCFLFAFHKLYHVAGQDPCAEAVPDEYGTKCGYVKSLIQELVSESDLPEVIVVIHSPRGLLHRFVPAGPLARSLSYTHDAKSDNVYSAARNVVIEPTGEAAALQPWASFFDALWIVAETKLKAIPSIQER